MELKEFLELECPEEWDFVNEFSEAYQKIEDPFKRFFVFRLKKDRIESSVYADDEAAQKFAKQRIPQIKDPDSGSKLMQVIYKQLWAGVPIVNDKAKVRGDTMISLQTTLNVIMRGIDDGRQNALKTILQRKPRGKYSINYAIALYAKTEESGAFAKELRHIDGLEDLICHYHTIGNFLPVPDDFNQFKASHAKDYWDLTLNSIYKWYMGVGEEEAQNDRLLSLLLEGDSPKAPELEKVASSCRSWLTDFDTWQNFVEKNFLQDFVTSSNGTYGKPKELWPGHFTGKVLPEDIEQMKAFCENASAWILERGKKMITKLKGIENDVG